MSVRNRVSFGTTFVALAASANLMGGCGAQSGESAAAFQRLAAEFAPLAQAKAQGLPLRALAVANLPASNSALPVVALGNAQAPKPASKPADPMRPDAAAMPAPTKAPHALPMEERSPLATELRQEPAPVALAAANEAKHQTLPALDAAPNLTRLLEMPMPEPLSRVLFSAGGEDGVSWKALGRGADALLAAEGYAAKHTAALGMGEKLHLQGWKNPSLELKLAPGSGALRLVWASEGELPEEHVLGTKLLAKQDNLLATVPLGAYAHRPGRLILVAKGDGGQQALRLLAITLRAEAPQNKPLASL